MSILWLDLSYVPGILPKQVRCRGPRSMGAIQLELTSFINSDDWGFCQVFVDFCRPRYLSSVNLPLEFITQVPFLMHRYTRPLRNKASMMWNTATMEVWLKRIEIIQKVLLFWGSHIPQINKNKQLFRVVIIKFCFSCHQQVTKKSHLHVW